MAQVQVDYDQDAEELILLGLNPAIVRNPLFASFCRRLGAETAEDGSTRISTTIQDLPARYRAIGKVLLRAGASLIEGAHVSDILTGVERDEQAFKELTSRAYEVWTGDIDTALFREFVKVVEAQCPARTFYRKQLLSAFHLALSLNACNFSVPGAGKTSVVYAAYAYLKSQSDLPNFDRLLIVGPLSSFKAWEDEYEEIFGVPPSSIRITGNLSRHERVDYLRGISVGSSGKELTLTSYQTLMSLKDEFRVFLNRYGDSTMLVLDEAHYIKRDDGSWASAALDLAPYAAARIVLTGTPAPNGYEDLSNLFKFIYPTQNLIGYPSSTLKAMTDGRMKRAVPELKDRIRTYYTRIKKSDLNLPAVDEHVEPVKFKPQHEKIYRSLERQIVSELRVARPSFMDGTRVRARLIRLRQACVNPKLLLAPIEDEAIFDTLESDYTITEQAVIDAVEIFDPAQDLERLQVCRSIVERILAAQGKVLVWSYFLGNIQLLLEELSDIAPFCEAITGSTAVGGDEDEYDASTREAIIDRFHSVDGPAILIANPQAVGESISLHKACRTAIYFDRDFNAARFIQSKDRIHRYDPNPRGDVTYIYLCSPGSVDEDIATSLRQKEVRLAELLDSDEIPILIAADDPSSDIKLILDAYERRKLH